MAEATNVTAVPTGWGADMFGVIAVSVSGAADEGVGEDGGGGWDTPAVVTGNAMLPFEFALSYASAVLPAFLTHTATRVAVLGVVGVHVHWLLDDHCRVTTQLTPS